MQSNLPRATSVTRAYEPPAIRRLAQNNHSISCQASSVKTAFYVSIGASARFQNGQRRREVQRLGNRVVDRRRRIFIQRGREPRSRSCEDMRPPKRMSLLGWRSPRTHLGSLRPGVWVPIPETCAQLSSERSPRQSGLGCLSRLRHRRHGCRRSTNANTVHTRANEAVERLTASLNLQSLV